MDSSFDSDPFNNSVFKSSGPSTPFLIKGTIAVGKLTAGIMNSSFFFSFSNSERSKHALEPEFTITVYFLQVSFEIFSSKL